MNEYIYNFLYDWLFKVFNEGVDGITIKWLGALADRFQVYPQPAVNDAYYDIELDKSCIWDGDNWQVFCNTDLNFIAGVFVWRWEKPVSPELNDAYFTGVKSVIWNGSIWDDLCFEDISTNITGKRPEEFKQVVRGLQNTPTPKGTYFVIHYPFQLRRICTAKKSKVSNTGKLEHFTFYEVPVTIEIVKGATDLLNDLFLSLRFQSIKDFFKKNGMGFLRIETVLNNPKQTTGEWFDEGGLVTFYITLADKVIERIGFIEQVEIKQVSV